MAGLRAVAACEDTAASWGSKMLLFGTLNKMAWAVSCKRRMVIAPPSFT